jgi:hypothetical protein
VVILKKKNKTKMDKNNNNPDNYPDLGSWTPRITKDGKYLLPPLNEELQKTIAYYHKLAIHSDIIKFSKKNTNKKREKKCQNLT